MKKVEFLKEVHDNYSMTEAFNSLRTNLAFCGEQNKVIVLTSSLPDEGKSKVALRLSRALGENGKKTLLIDCDIRKSVMVGKYQIQGIKEALTHYLSGQADMDEVIYDTPFENVNLVVAGPVAPNPTELLDSLEFQEMLEQARKDYDYVIIDAPPLGAVIDAAIIGKYADGAILVIEQNRIRRAMVESVVKQLKRSDVNILGAVLNKIDETNSSYYSGYYKGYYKEYGEYKN